MHRRRAVDATGCAPSQGQRDDHTLVCRAEVEIRSLDVFNLEIHGSGGTAYKSCDYCTSYSVAAEQMVRVMKGTHLWIMQKIEGDSWRVAVVSWSIWKDSGAA